MSEYQLPDSSEQLLAKLFRATNRSMACSTFSADVVASFDKKQIEILNSWGVRIANPDEPYDFDKASILEALKHPPAKESGRERIEYARKHMACLKYLSDSYAEKGNIFEGIRIAADLIIEPKTAVLVLKLAELGANIAIACLASSADENVIRALEEAGVRVYANTRNSVEDDYLDSLKILDDMKPHIILDDGAGLSKLLYLERPEYAENLIGICEETTSGVWALEQMQEEGILNVPAIAVNDSDIKTMFDNLHGTGESVILTMISILTEVRNVNYNADFDGDQMADTFNTDFDGDRMADTFNTDLDVGRMADTFNADLDVGRMDESGILPIFDGKKVLLLGYGAVGAGIAKRIRAFGATVTIAETNSVAALKAMHEGYEVKKAIDAVVNADIIISATGVRHTITEKVVEAAKDGAIIAVAGGTYNEVALNDFLGNEYLNTIDIMETEKATWDIRDAYRCVLRLKSGKALTVLTCGHGVNYTGGDGNPIEIMDLSFAGQFSALAYLIENKGKLESKVIRLPKEIAMDAASIRLNSLGVNSDTPAPPSDWRITRYNNEIND